MNFGQWLTNTKNWKTIIVPVLIIAAVFIGGRFVDVHKHLQSIQNWIWHLGPWGPVVYGLIYVGAMLILLPGTPFTIVAALLFGTLWGFVTMLTATTAAAVIGFVFARYVARDRIEKRFDQEEKFQTMKGWVENNPWLAIPFIRIMPVFPFAMNNYALGLTQITFWRFLATSEVIFIPMTAVLILGASALYSAMIKGEVSWWLIIGSTGTGIVLLVFGMWAKRTFSNEKKKI